VFVELASDPELEVSELDFFLNFFLLKYLARPTPIP
jgi:hypothetical protein